MSLFNRRSPYELDERNAWEDHNGDELQKEFRFADEILGHIPRTELLARNAWESFEICESNTSFAKQVEKRNKRSGDRVCMSASTH